MSWSSTFLAGLSARQVALRFIVEVVTVNAEPGLAWSVGSHRGLGDSRSVAVRGLRQQGATLSARSWTSTIGTTTFDVSGDMGEWSLHVTRGTVLAVRVGLPGMAAADFQTVAVGPYRSRRGVGPRWTVEVLDLFSALTQRWDTATLSTSLFQGTPSGTTIAVNYTAGDSALKVASTANAIHETGGPGMVRVTPTTGDPFYLTYDGVGTSPTRLTDCSSTGRLETTAVDAVVGDAVAFLPYLRGHPLDVVRKVLTSRGDASNGTYDTLPLDWALGIADEWLDHDDIDAYKSTAVVVTSGTYNWHLIVEASQANAYGWITETWAKAGLFPALRQGALTFRAAQSTIAAARHSGLTITDADVAELLAYEDYASELASEYEAVAVYTALGSGALNSEKPATVPVAPDALTYVLDGVYNPASFIPAETAARLTEAGTRIPEVLSLRLATMRLAKATIGDIVTLDLTRIPSRRDGKAGFVDRDAMVMEVSPDWTGWSTTVTLYVYPEGGDTFE